MPKIDKVKWGKVWIDGKVYHQVLILGEEVVKRDKKSLKALFGTTHTLGDWEEKMLLTGSPEILLIANGWQGVLRVSDNFKYKVAKRGIDLKLVLIV